MRPDARGAGAGRALLSTLAGICVERGYARLEWWVLHWNPARDFYAGIGATAMDEWVPYRIDGEALRSWRTVGFALRHGSMPGCAPHARLTRACLGRDGSR